MRLRSRFAVLGLLALAASGCAHAPGGKQRALQPAPKGSESSLGGLLESDLAGRYLFRVRYQGPAGSGMLRMILDVDSSERYAITTKDRFGRGLWRLESGSAGALLVDDRRKLYCRAADGVRIPEMALESLPLDELPAVLLGRLPANLVRSSETGESRADEYRDRRDRRWTVRGAPARPESWTVWESEEPWLWWRRHESDGGVLSHRGGSQFRWKLVAKEARSGVFETVEPGAQYVPIDCDHWALGASRETSKGH